MNNRGRMLALLALTLSALLPLLGASLAHAATENVQVTLTAQWVNGTAIPSGKLAVEGFQNNRFFTSAYFDTSFFFSPGNTYQIQAQNSSGYYFQYWLSASGQSPGEYSFSAQSNFTLTAVYSPVLIVSTSSKTTTQQQGSTILYTTTITSGTVTQINIISGILTVAPSSTTTNGGTTIPAANYTQAISSGSFGIAAVLVLTLGYGYYRSQDDPAKKLKKWEDRKVKVLRDNRKSFWKRFD